MHRLVALFVCMSVAIGCGGGEGEGSTQGATTTVDDEGSSDAAAGSTGETSTAGTMPSSAAATDDGSSGGGGLSPTATCNDYLACAAATVPARLGPLIETYGPDGTCWQSTPEIAEQCDMACGVGLMQLARTYPDEPACGGDGSADSGSDSGEPECEADRDCDYIVCECRSAPLKYRSCDSGMCADLSTCPQVCGDAGESSGGG